MLSKCYDWLLFINNPINSYPRHQPLSAPAEELGGGGCTSRKSLRFWDTSQRPGKNLKELRGSVSVFSAGNSKKFERSKRNQSPASEQRVLLVVFGFLNDGWRAQNNRHLAGDRPGVWENPWPIVRTNKQMVVCSCNGILFTKEEELGTKHTAHGWITKTL